MMHREDLDRMDFQKTDGLDMAFPRTKRVGGFLVQHENKILIFALGLVTFATWAMWRWR